MYTVLYMVNSFITVWQRAWSPVWVVTADESMIKRVRLGAFHTTYLLAKPNLLGIGSKTAVDSLSGEMIDLDLMA